MGDNRQAITRRAKVIHRIGAKKDTPGVSVAPSLHDRVQLGSCRCGRLDVVTTGLSSPGKGGLGHRPAGGEARALGSWTN
ncbi:hypothetical protein HPP92_028365 [Vanilla planifolia]|uniref:Uncharacterized protein n=1 Tax=Vanilla planifolia TaxID=51239 RepID=A0A835P834_VANPL|nr:hypothetical protein HPP92_028365 [Vanilla planifolia]